MAKEDGFNETELKVFAFLADDKGHALWQMCNEMNIDEGRLSKILKGLNSKGLIYKKERSLDRPAGERGPKIEYPWYIQKDRLSDITEIIFSQIRDYTLKMSLARRGEEKLNYKHKASQNIELCKKILKSMNLDSNSYNGLCDMIDLTDFGAPDR